MIKGLLIKHGRVSGASVQLGFNSEERHSLIAVIKSILLYRFKLLFILFMLLLSAAFSSASAQSIEDSIDEDRISAGESTVIRHKISGADGEIKPVSVPAVQGLRIDYTGMQRSFQFINGKTWNGIIFSFMVSADKPGKYKIPKFIYDIGGKKVSTRELSLAVNKGSGMRQGRQGTGAQAKLDTAVEASKRKIYAGEPVVFRYYLLSSGLRNIKFIGREQQADAKGFVVREFKEEIEDSVLNNDVTKYHLYTLIFIPAQTGTLDAGGGTSVVSFDADTGFFDFKRQYRVSFENIPVKVSPLPEIKNSDSFKGAVGNFIIRAEYSKDPVKTYDEKKINIIIKGTGNLVSLAKPDFEKDQKGIKILAVESQPEISLKGSEVSGEKKFTFTVIPEKQGELNLGAVVFSYFNPEKGAYVTLKTEDILFNVTQGGKEKASRELETDQSENIDFNFLYIIVIVVIAGGIGAGAFFWEKKRPARAMQAAKKDLPADIVQPSEAKQDYIRDMSSALFRMDKRAFLSATDNALSEIAKETEGNNAEEISKFKDEIYLYRFGGGELSQIKMEEILGRMNSLKSLKV